MLILIVAHDANCEIIENVTIADHYVLYKEVEPDHFDLAEDFDSIEEMAGAIRTISMLCKALGIDLLYKTSTEMAVELAKYDVTLSNSPVSGEKQ